MRAPQQGAIMSTQNRAPRACFAPAPRLVVLAVVLTGRSVLSLSSCFHNSSLHWTNKNLTKKIPGVWVKRESLKFRQTLTQAGLLTHHPETPTPHPQGLPQDPPGLPRDQTAPQDPQDPPRAPQDPPPHGPPGPPGRPRAQWA